MKIKYASNKFIPEKRARDSWHLYLLTGFRKLGHHVELSDELAKKSFCELGKNITYIEIDSQLIIYDWSDFHLIHNYLPHKLYFKIQLKKGMSIPNVYPIGQTVCNMKYFNFLPNRKEKTIDVTAIFKTTNFHMRTTAVEHIQAMNINAEAWCDNFQNRERYAYAKPTLSFEDHLLTQARSKICVAMPGVGGDWTWRHTEILGLGCCMIIPKLEYQYPGGPLGSCERPWIECKRDLSDLQHQIRFLLRAPSAITTTEDLARGYFYKYLTPEAQALWVLEKL